MKTKIIILLILCFFLTGCNNYRELNDLAIVSAIGIKKENNQIKLTIQVLDTNQDSNENTESKFIIFNTTGKTVQEAIRNVMMESSKRLFINQLQILLIDEELAKDGINDIIDFFFRDPESRKQYIVLIANDDINDILSTKTLLEKISGMNIRERIRKNDKYLNNINDQTFAELISDYMNPYKDMIITTVDLIKNDSEEDEIEPKNEIILSKTAIFNKDKLVGYIDPLDVIYYNFVRNNINNTLLTIKHDNKNASIEVISNKTKLKNEENKIIIELNMEASINDINFDLDLTKNENIKLLENLYEEDLNKEILESINKTIKDYAVDIYGFTDFIYRNDNKYFKNNNITINDLVFEIKTNINLAYKGNGVDNIHE